LAWGLRHRTAQNRVSADLSYAARGDGGTSGGSRRSKREHTRLKMKSKVEKKGRGGPNVAAQAIASGLRALRARRKGMMKTVTPMLVFRQLRKLSAAVGVVG